MKSSNCYLCDSANAEILFTFKGKDKYLATVFETPPEVDMNWMICKDCSLIYRSPVLEQNEYEKLYDNYDTDIFSEQTPDEYFDKIISLPEGKSENREKASWLKEVLVKIKGCVKPKILDIGCGGGTLLYFLNEELSPQSMSGVELNQAYAKLAQKRLDADIRNIAYKNGIFGENFDLLINTKVLEHIPEPLPFLQEMNKDLCEEGLLFIEVPHFFDMYNFPLDDERFAIPHIYFFSENTLGTLLNKAGFDVIDSRIFDASRKRSYLQVVAKKVAFDEVKLALPSFLDDIHSIIRRVRNNKNKMKIDNEKI